MGNTSVDLETEGERRGENHYLMITDDQPQEPPQMCSVFVVLWHLCSDSACHHCCSIETSSIDCIVKQQSHC